jgi:putative toxin-antitoxin system antitoxin component (TIGR02293 family)
MAKLERHLAEDLVMGTVSGMQDAQMPFGEAPDLLGLAPGAALSLATHDALVTGLPAAALRRAVERVGLLRDQPVFESVMAMSLRTYQRLRDQPEKRLDLDASGRLWRFADILARTADLLGGQAAPQPGLEQRRPIDLLATPAGAALVEDLLGRMDYGVYA